ncbi:HNH endonuclease [Burkholderia cepacia]|uniref:HNH endonuclease n=1 Tax=Burkholderia cepacia TaxID=292 RepID=UPI0027D302A7|nr:HNH endonuclease signature motif containing protein [Burkholderia cepacia]
MSISNRPLTAKQKVRVAAAGNAVRIDDLSGGAWDVIRKRIRKRDGYCCRACGIAVRAGVVDHIKPLAQGGSNEDENLQLLCKECHDDKTNADQGYKVRRRVGFDGMPEGWA